MRIRLLLAATAVVTLAACSESSTAPHQMSPDARPNADQVTCRSGYHIATRSDGTEYCEADGIAAAQAAAAPTAKKK